MAILATVTTQNSRPLENLQWEAFAQAIVSGDTKHEAALKAGYSSTSARQQGTKLYSDTRIASRIASLKIEIASRVQEIASPANIRAQGFIAQQVQERGYRLKIAQEMVDRHLCVIAARAEENRGMVAGGESGLHVRTVRGIGSGANFREVVEYTIDRAASAELGVWLDRAAVDSGDRDEKIIKDHKPVDDSLSGLTVEQLYARQAILLEAKAKIEALESGKSVEAHRVIEARPVDEAEPVVQCNTGEPEDAKPCNTDQDS